jgi:glycosyltransferase involved in cell wall biosynthesis
MKKGITLIIPAHNEGDGIFETISEIDFHVKNFDPFYIFVSEDGSSDNTRTEVLKAQKSNLFSKVILSSPSDRLGYSRAVQRGIRECETELICFMDADGQCDPKDLAALIRNLPENGIVVGYRNPRVDGFNRIIYSKLFGIVFRLLGGPKRKDPSSPFVIARTSEIRIFAKVAWHLSFGFWWEFQWRAQSLGLEVKEIPVNHRVRSAGITQVYTVKKLPRIIRTHLFGLWALRKELNS